MTSEGAAPSRIGRFVGLVRHRRYLRSMYLLSNLYDGAAVSSTPADASTRALVISPHQDDEVIGCGGTLRKAVERGSHVKVVYLTDGGKGAEGIPAAEQTRTREREAEAGLKVLGIEDKQFLRFPDQGLVHSPEAVRTIFHIINDFSPHIMFVPFYLDTHPDHAIAARIVGEALRSYPREVDCYSYEVWSALPPNIIIDVSDVMEMKDRALRMHASQISARDYPEKVRGLNAFRSMQAGPEVTHCEAFIKQSKDEFLRMLGT